MTLIQTAELRPNQDLTWLEDESIYNGLDCCVTLEVLEELEGIHRPLPKVYDFALSLQGPVIEIMNRGFLIDEAARKVSAKLVRDRIKFCQQRLDLFASTIWRAGLNPRSHKQLTEFFYGALRLPEIKISKKGIRSVSCNREALETIEERYSFTRPIISLIFKLRDLNKDLEVLECPIDEDGRMRFQLSIAGTETGRLSSFKSVTGTGRNNQNIEESLRWCFIADPGYKLVSIDLEQVEARDVGFIEGNLFGDWTFLNSCESGDLHTNNCKLIWPELEWTGDPGEDKRVAEKEFYRGYSYRYMSKRGGHLSNYMGSAWTASRSLKVPIGIMDEFQKRYCKGEGCAYPAHQKWWNWVGEQVQTKGYLDDLFGVRRYFFGRPSDDATLREAIAHCPQASTGRRTNLGLWRIWKYQPRVKVLTQTHDSVTFEAKDDENFDLEVEAALEHMRVEMTGNNGRKYIVPGEAKVGYNWGPMSETNERGLRKWKRTQNI